MYKWLIWLGYVLLALGAALLTPLADLLPVEFLPYLSGDFARSGTHYFRVAPSSSSAPSFLAVALLAMGAAVAAIGWLFRWRTKRAA